MADITEKPSAAADGEADIMMESSSISDSMEASGTVSNCPSETESTSGMSVTTEKPPGSKPERERHESTSSNSDVHMMPPSPVSRDQVRF